jgi:hypothetical protein
VGDRASAAEFEARVPVGAVTWEDAVASPAAVIVRRIAFVDLHDLPTIRDADLAPFADVRHDLLLPLIPRGAGTGLSDAMNYMRIKIDVKDPRKLFSRHSP